MQVALALAYQSAFGEPLPVGYLDVMAMRAALSSAPFRPTSTTGGVSAARVRVSIAVPKRVASKTVVWGGIGAGAVMLAVVLVGFAGWRSERSPNVAAGMLENAPFESESVVELAAASAAIEPVADEGGLALPVQASDADSPPAAKDSERIRRPMAPSARPQPAPMAVPNCDPPWTIDPTTRGRKVKPGC